jgi:hypothetical protein
LQRKSQTPNPKFQAITKFQGIKNPKGADRLRALRSEQSGESGLEFDVLEFVWDLEPGIWDFRSCGASAQILLQ